MTNNSPQESAQIYQFPLRGRFATGREEEHAALSARYAKVAFGGSWYHDEAIQEERAHKN